MSGESDTSMVTWKSDSAAGLMETSGVWVQMVVSCLTEADIERRRRLWWRFRLRRRFVGPMGEGRGKVWRGAWGLR